MIKLVIGIIYVKAVTLYTPEDFVNRCKGFGIRDDDCMKFTYVQNANYDNFLRSFNLPIQKDPECERKKCFVSIFKDPPQVFINSTGNINCVSPPPNNNRGYPLESCQSYPTWYQSDKQKNLQNNGQESTFNVTTTVVSQENNFSQPPSSAVQTSSPKEGQLLTVSNNKKQQSTLREDPGSTSTGDCKDKYTQKSSSTTSSDQIVTVIRPVYSTITVDSPITLYREVTTTVLHEVPLTNYKITTFTEEVPTTKTIERTLISTSTETTTATSMMYKTESITKTMLSTLMDIQISTKFTKHDLSTQIEPGVPSSSSSHTHSYHRTSRMPSTKEKEEVASSSVINTKVEDKVITTTLIQEKTILTTKFSTITKFLYDSNTAFLTHTGYKSHSSTHTTRTSHLSGKTILQDLRNTNQNISSSSVTSRAEVSEKTTSETSTIDISTLLRPIIDQLSMPREEKSTEKEPKSISSMVQEIVYKTTTLPPRIEVETTTVESIRTVTKNKAVDEKMDESSGDQKTVYNTVYSYKDKGVNPNKVLCKLKKKEYSDEEEEEIVTTVFVYKHKQNENCKEGVV